MEVKLFYDREPETHKAIGVCEAREGERLIVRIYGSKLSFDSKHIPITDLEIIKDVVDWFEEETELTFEQWKRLKHSA
jgi:hypothetical protein